MQLSGLSPTEIFIDTVEIRKHFVSCREKDQIQTLNPSSDCLNKS